MAAHLSSTGGGHFNRVKDKIYTLSHPFTFSCRKLTFSSPEVTSTSGLFDEQEEDEQEEDDKEEEEDGKNKKNESFLLD